MTTWLRHKERKEIWQLYLARGKNVAQIGPRRLGKTFLMDLLEEDSSEKGFHAISIDLQTEISAAGAVAKIAQAIIDDRGLKGNLEHFWVRLKNIVNDAESFDALAKALESKNSEVLTRQVRRQDWAKILDHLLGTLNENSEQKTLLLIDELSICLQAMLSANRDAGKHFMHTLRSLRGKYPNVLWVITGSIGLHLLEKNFNLDATNDLEIFHLQPLTKAQARALLRHECSERGIPDVSHTVLDDIIQRQGWLSPHYLLKWLDRLEALLIQDEGLTIDKSVIDRVQEQLLTHPYNKIFDNWSSHINRNYPDKEKRHAKRVLNVISQVADGRSRDGLMTDKKTADIPEGELDTVLQMLTQDGFLGYDTDSEKYDFVFALLKMYWQRFETV